VETFTFLFTDVEGSTALLARLGDDAYAQVLAGHHALIRTALAAHDGSEVDTQGDAFFAVFSSPRACVAAVLQMQQALAAHAWPGGEQVRVRMGIHCGEAVKTATGLVGLEVHRAARVAAVGYGGQVLVSEAAAVLVRDGLPPGAALADLGVHRLKDLSRPERIFQLQAAGLQSEFPPLRSLGNPALPNNLPAQLSAFIGRDREVAEVRALVQSARLVTLTGAGGCGKTRLGLQVAAELLDGSGDGVWLAELAAVTDEDAVPAAICDALRLAVNPGRPALEALLDALTLQDVLIVVDNCEHLIGGCAKTVEAIVRRCPQVHLLATSREPLGIGGEAIYRVPSLSLPGPADPAAPAPGSSDAVALFAERARAHGVALDVDGQAGPLVVSVCRRLDGMPLAIELAAARLRSMSLAELHDRLDQRFRLLTGGSRTALERQQTLRATVGWSYSLLAGAERVLLARLSVFAGSFGLDAAEAVCGSGDLDVLDVADLLGSLVDKSLVVAEPAGTGLRYRLLETIRLFAAERLVESGEGEAAAAAAAHCAHFLAVAEAAAAYLTGPEQGKWLARLDADRANLRRAAGYAAGRPDGTALVLRLGAVAAALEQAALTAASRGAPDMAAELTELAAVLTPLDPLSAQRRRAHAGGYLFLAGDTARARRDLEALVQEMPAGADRAEALLGLARILVHDAGDSVALPVLEKALKEASADQRLQARIHISLARTCGDNLLYCASHAEAGLTLAQQAGDPGLTGEAMQQKMYADFMVGRGLDLKLGYKAMELERDGTPPQVEERAAMTMAQCLVRADRFDEARPLLEQMLQAAREEGDDSSLPLLLAYLADLECWAGNWQAAERHASASWEAGEQVGHRVWRTVTLYAQALIDAHLGRIDAARARAREGLSVAAVARDMWMLILLHGVLGFAELSAGNLKAAEASLSSAVDFADRVGLAEPAAWRFHANHIEAVIGLGDLGRAETLLGRLDGWGRATGRAWTLSTAARCRALLLAARGDTDGAVQSLERALRHHQQLAMPFELGRTLLVMGQVQRRAKRKRIAREHLERAWGIFESLPAPPWAERARSELSASGSAGLPHSH